MDVPVLETERLILREHRRADLAPCAAMWSDPAVFRHISGKPSTDNQSWMRLLAFSGHWGLLGFGFWAVEEKSSGAYVGQIGFADFHREIESSFEGAPEIGWVLASPFHGQGYGTEGVRAALAWGDAFFTAPRTVCMIAPENAASIRLAEKFGYREYARTTFLDGPVRLFERFAS